MSPRADELRLFDSSVHTFFRGQIGSWPDVFNPQQVETFAVTSHRCDVFWADVRGWGGASDLPLTDEERGRVGRLRDARAQQSRAVGFYLLRWAAAAVTGVSADLLAVDRTCTRCGDPHGRPVLPDLDLDVSVTRSGDVVGVAVGRGFALGLDVEDPTRFSSMRLARAVLGAGEDASSADQLCRYWTRKEATVKATGEGLGVGLRNVTVSRPDEAAQLLSYPGRFDLVVQMADLTPPVPYLAALVLVTCDPVAVVEHLVSAPSASPGEQPMVHVVSPGLSSRPARST